MVTSFSFLKTSCQKSKISDRSVSKWLFLEEFEDLDLSAFAVLLACPEVPGSAFGADGPSVFFWLSAPVVSECVSFLLMPSAELSAMVAKMRPTRSNSRSAALAIMSTKKYPR